MLQEYSSVENLYLTNINMSKSSVFWQQQLYLAGNQITSLVSLPELPNLEVDSNFRLPSDSCIIIFTCYRLINRACFIFQFLSVAQNKLKSLSMASQPRLQVYFLFQFNAFHFLWQLSFSHFLRFNQVLAASKNRLTTLKGFPHLPALEVSHVNCIHVVASGYMSLINIKSLYCDSMIGL